MFTSIASVSISGRLDAKLRALAEAGFDGVELVENDLLTYDGSAADVGRTIRELGLKCTALQPVREFEGMAEPVRSRNFQRVEHQFEIMEQLGCDLLIVAGTSGEVYPAAALPHYAKANGARVVEVNPSPPPLSVLADDCLRAPAGIALPALVDAAWPEA